MSQQHKPAKERERDLRLAIRRIERGRAHTNAQQKREARDQAFEAWERVTCVPMLGRLVA